MYHYTWPFSDRFYTCMIFLLVFLFFFFFFPGFSLTWSFVFLLHF